jgi:hypothetical protein
MRIGTMFFGEVEQLLGESVQTKFFVLGVPLIPLGSFYFTGPEQGFEIPLHGKSMLLGYVRIGTWIGVLLCGLFAYLGRNHDSADTWIAGSVLLVLAIVTTFVLGKLSAGERLRRLALKSTAGIGAPPEWLPVETRTKLAASLTAQWKADHTETWESAIAAGTKSVLLFALAEYHVRPELAQQALAQLQTADIAED